MKSHVGKQISVRTGEERRKIDLYLKISEKLRTRAELQKFLEKSRCSHVIMCAVMQLMLTYVKVC
jgi:hypothetical protein